MARPFKPLPLHVFSDAQRPYIARLNQDLNDLFRLEGVLRSPASSNRSDKSIVRRDDSAVDVSRITPSIVTVVSGASTVVGAPSLTLSTSNAAGTTTTAIATDSTIALFGTQAPSDLATSAAVGTSAFAARADHVHEFGESLAAASDRTDTVTLTDDATEGALLAASAAYAVNGLALKAPNATNTLRVGKFGNLALAGTALADHVLCNFAKTDYNETTVIPRGFNIQITNTNTGTATAVVQGVPVSVSGTMAGATSPSTNPVQGVAVTMQGGNTGNTYFQGVLQGVGVLSVTATASAVGTSVSSVRDFRASPSNVFTRVALTERVCFDAPGAVTLLTSATLLNHYGFRSTALTVGSTRVSYRAEAITTGTPGVAYSFQSLLHSVGTTRRGLISDNSNESTAGDWICNSATRGLVTKDTQGRYWRSGNSASGTSGGSIRIDVNGFMYVSRETGSTGDLDWQMIDVGTSVPAA